MEVVSGWNTASTTERQCVDIHIWALVLAFDSCFVLDGMSVCSHKSMYLPVLEQKINDVA
jgi:hypothetical protein